MKYKGFTYDKNIDYVTVAPRIVFGVDLNTAAFKHDVNYKIQDLIREEADILFMNDIFKLFIDAGKPFRGNIISFIYFLGVRCFGWIRW